MKLGNVVQQSHNIVVFIIMYMFQSTKRRLAGCMWTVGLHLSPEYNLFLSIEKNVF